MGNRLNPLLLNNFKYSYLNNSFSVGSSLILNSDLNFLFLIQNFFFNLNLNMHSFFIRRIDSKIYLFFYYYSNKQIKVKNKYISRNLVSIKKSKITKKKKKIFSKLYLRKKNLLNLYFFIISLSLYYYNTKNVYVSLVNLNYFNGSFFRDFDKNKKKKYFIRKFNKIFFDLTYKFNLNKNQYKKKKIRKYSMLVHYFQIRQNRFFPKTRFIFRRNFNLPNYLKGFDFLLFHSFLYQSSKILGFYLKNLIELNFHIQKGLRQKRILYFFKRFFYSFIISNKEKKFFFRKFASFLILKGKFKKDGRKKKKIIKLDLPLRKQKKDSFMDYYSQDIFTRFGSLNFILYIKGQHFYYNFPSNYLIKSRFSKKNSILISGIKNNIALKLLFYFIFVFYHVKFISKIQSFKKKKKKRKNKIFKIRK